MHDAGPDGLSVPGIGLGCRQLGGGRGNDWSDDVAQQTVRTAVDAGVESVEEGLICLQQE
jgi:aryl-alcohol dehydrogenase-like predicted oxidoreductase